MPSTESVSMGAKQGAAMVTAVSRTFDSTRAISVSFSVKQGTDPRQSALLFALVLVGVYVLTPLVVNSFELQHPYFGKLAGLAAVAAISILVGYIIPIIDSRFRTDARRIAIPASLIHIGAWGTFSAFLLVAFTTAEVIPLKAALELKWTEDELSAMRESFLKTRTGWEGLLVYVSAILTTTVLPYSLARLFVDGSRFRYAGLVLFLGYSLSFLQKALYLNVVAPMVYLVAQRRIWNPAKGAGFVLVCVALMYANTKLSKGIPEPPPPPQPQVSTTTKAPASPVASAAPAQVESTYFTSRYRPSGAIDHIVWRVVAVPVFTAADALLVFDQELNGKHTIGATSSLLAKVIGAQRVPLENMVYQYQWRGGQASGRSNSVYFIETFVNFGWLGVVIVSMFVGQSLRWFCKSQDEAFRSLWPLYVFALFASGFLGNMLSNGFVFLFAFALVCRVTPVLPGGEVGLERSVEVVSSS